MMKIAKATRPMSRSSGVSPVGGRGGPRRPFGLRGTRWASTVSAVSGSSKKSKSMSRSRSLIGPGPRWATLPCGSEGIGRERGVRGGAAERSEVPTVARPGPIAAGELVLDRFRPIRPLGSGGSGSVWLARDERTGLEVALKIVPREGKAGSRAEREASAAARLRHERCLRAYSLQRDERHVYIAYEYVPGETMRDAMRGGRLNDAAALEAAAQVLDALAHAHASGIVHRDVKPSNVLLAAGPELSVRLLDFGLAQIETEQTLTAVGDVPGTLAYISPERLPGERGGPAGGSWAGGVMLWEALAGYHPFWTASLLETAKRIQEGAPSLRDARPDLPEPVLAAVAAARLLAAVAARLALDRAPRPTATRLATVLRKAHRASREPKRRVTVKRP